MVQATDEVEQQGHDEFDGLLEETEGLLEVEEQEEESRMGGFPGSKSSGTSPAPRTKARTLDELEGAAGLYDDDMLERAYMDRGSRATMQWVNQVTTGLTNKFSMLKSDAVETEQLESVYDLAMRVDELKRSLSNSGLVELFLIYEIDEKRGSRLKTVPKNLLDHYGTISLDDVVVTVKWVKEWDDDHFVWAQTLTLRLVESSCEPELRERVSEQMMGMSPFASGGATYFKLAMMSITSMSYTVSMTLSIRLTKLTIKQFDGEDVLKLISFLRGAIQRLKMNDMLPPHMPYLVYQMLQTSSCTTFNGFFASLYAREQADIAVAGGLQQLDTETLFRLADQQYRAHIEEGTWVKKSRHGAGFLAGVICWYCKQEGHLSKDCKKKLRDSKRKGTGAGTGNDKGTANAAAPEVPSVKPWRKPPGAGEPEERTHKNKVEYWCGKCKCWNRTHKTAEHKTKAELQAASESAGGNGNAQGGANAAADASRDSTRGISNAAFLSNGFS